MAKLAKMPRKRHVAPRRRRRREPVRRPLRAADRYPADAAALAVAEAPEKMPRQRNVAPGRSQPRQRYMSTNSGDITVADVHGYDGRPIGTYAGNDPPPMDTAAARIREVIVSLFGPPALEYAGTHDPIGTYYGLDVIPPVEFPFGPPKANTEGEFEAGGYQEITWEP